MRAGIRHDNPNIIETENLILQLTVYFHVSVSPVVSTYLMLRHPYYLETKRYNICQGREEAYLYPDLDFYNEEFVGPLNRISMRDPTRYED